MFDLPFQDTLVSLDASESPMSVKGLQGVGSVKRVEDIYEDPAFIVDGATASDVRQGINGDCWFLAAITALSGKPDLIDKLCIHRDEQVGVYGFVFFRGMCAFHRVLIYSGILTSQKMANGFPKLSMIGCVFVKQRMRVIIRLNG
jgi:hypothetical protein